MKKMIKTNAMRILDQAHIPYEIHTYEHHESDPVDGIHVAAQLNELVECVFKTLITAAAEHHYYVFVLPVHMELDLKKCAKAVNEKRVELIPVKQLQAVSGYIRGGCSPIGMKKSFPTVFHHTALDYDCIYFSGGKIGCQIAINPKTVIDFIHAKTDDIVKQKDE